MCGESHELNEETLKSIREQKPEDYSFKEEVGEVKCFKCEKMVKEFYFIPAEEEDKRKFVGVCKECKEIYDKPYIMVKTLDQFWEVMEMRATRMEKSLDPNPPKSI